MKGEIIDQLREIAFPESTSLKAPNDNEIAFPEFRCVALDYCGNQDDFELIKCHMLRELNLHKEMYLKLYDT
jgi:hypothetical protein